MLRYYFTKTQHEEPLLVDLVDLALKTVTHDDVLCSVLIKKPTRCIRCGLKRAEPAALHVHGHTEVVMLCAKCDDGKDLTDYVLKLANHERLDSVFLWEIEGEVRMLTNALETEVIVRGKPETHPSQH